MRVAMFGVKGMPYPGGIEQTIEEIGPRLVKRGHEVVVYVRSFYTKERIDDYKGMKIIQTSGIHSKHLDAITHTTTATVDALFRGTDMFFYHSIGLAPFAFLPRLFGKPSLVQVHGLDWEREKWGTVAKAYLKVGDYCTAHFPNKAFAVSRNNVAHFRTKYSKDVTFLPNGKPDLKYREPNKIKELGLEKENYILFASRLVPEKGCHYLLDAFENIETDIKLVIAGDTSVHDTYYKNLLKRKSKRVLFTGFATGELMEELYGNAALFVQPSEIEGLSNSVLSALSLGRCVLASDVPGNMELIGECGFTFANKNVQDLAEKLEFLLANPDIRQSTGVKASLMVESEYDWEKIADQLHLSLIEI